MNANRFTMQAQTLLALTTQTLNFTVSPGDNFKVNTARTIEIWARTTNVSGAAATLNLFIETSVGIGFVQVDSITGITTNTTNSIIVNRADDALGTSMRIRATITGTTPTFDVEIVGLRME